VVSGFFGKDRRTHLGAAQLDRNCARPYNEISTVNNFFDLMNQFEAQQKLAGQLCFSARFW